MTESRAALRHCGAFASRKRMAACWDLGLAPLALVASLVLCSQIIGCRAEEHFFDVTGELWVPSAAEHYEEALRTARDWKGDAYLSSVRAGVGASSDATRRDASLSYYFESSSARTAYISLRLAGGTWTSEVQRKSSVETYSPIRPEDWPLDSVDAWSMALANGGEDFLIDHQQPSTSMHATLTYSRIGEQENVLVWEVDFVILFGPRLLLKIDPKTGEILEVITR